jgi:hypothetical protein
MRRILLRAEQTRDESNEPTRLDQQALLLQRAFVRAHGQPRGPVSTLTSDRRMEIATKAGAPLE